MKLTEYDSRLVLVEGSVEEAFEHARKPTSYKFNKNYNIEHYEKALRDPETDFRGGTYEGLFTSPDMTPFQDAKKALEKTGLVSKIVQRTEKFNRRRRTLSAHDGEWDMSRQWEIEPFTKAKRQSTSNKIVDIECHINASCAVSASDISKYGCLVWAINDIIEGSGINTSIKFIAKSISTNGYRSNRYLDTHIIFEIKKPGEYVNPQYIARTLTSNFLRRVAFSWFVIGCDFANEDVDTGLGRPAQNREGVFFENGKLVITSEAIRNGQQVNIEKSIINAIMGDNKK